MSLSTYLITCITEGGRFVTDYRTDIPIHCPNNIDHTIDDSQTIVYHTQSLKTVSLYQGGSNNFFYKALSYPFVPIVPGDNVYTITAYYSTVPRLITIFPTADNIGDLFSLLLEADTTIGTITADTSTSDNFIVVDNDVLTKIQLGVRVYLTDGVDTLELDDVIVIDGNILYFPMTIPEVYLAGSEVLTALPYLDDVPIVNINNISIGSTTLFSSQINVGSKIRVQYKNNGMSNKTISFCIEMNWGVAPTP
jgi:hypothetical protein